MNNNSKYKFLSYLFLLLTVFVIFLFTKSIYWEIVQNNKQRQSLTESLQQKQTEYDKIAKIKSDIDTWNVEALDFDKYLINFSEDEIVDYFYSYTKTHPQVSIESLGISEETPNEFWFREATIDLNLTFSSEQDMMSFMTNHILNSPKYNLYIHQFNYPFWNINWPFAVNIPVKILYK